jgi:NADH:ubiquinone oxidoreductase subunit E
MKQFKKKSYQNLLKNVGEVTEQNLFMLLGKIQDTFGHVPRQIIHDLAIKTGVPEARIYGALTSYKDFKVKSENRNS